MKCNLNRSFQVKKNPPAESSVRYDKAAEEWAVNFGISSVGEEHNEQKSADRNSFQNVPVFQEGWPARAESEVEEHEAARKKQ